MTDNSEIILGQILTSKNQEIAPELSPEEFFEVFTAEQATKDYELSYEEIQAGIVDGEHDGGIDAFYTFVNGECVGEEVSFPLPKKMLMSKSPSFRVSQRPVSQKHL